MGLKPIFERVYTAVKYVFLKMIARMAKNIETYNKCLLRVANVLKVVTLNKFSLGYGMFKVIIIII